MPKDPTKRLYGKRRTSPISISSASESTSPISTSASSSDEFAMMDYQQLYQLVEKSGDAEPQYQLAMRYEQENIAARIPTQYMRQKKQELFKAAALQGHAGAITYLLTEISHNSPCAESYREFFMQLPEEIAPVAKLLANRMHVDLSPEPISDSSGELAPQVTSNDEQQTSEAESYAYQSDQDADSSSEDGVAESSKSKRQKTDEAPQKDQSFVALLALSIVAASASRLPEPKIDLEQENPFRVFEDGDIAKKTSAYMLIQANPQGFVSDVELQPPLHNFSIINKIFWHALSVSPTNWSTTFATTYKCLLSLTDTGEMPPIKNFARYQKYLNFLYDLLFYNKAHKCIPKKYDFTNMVALIPSNLEGLEHLFSVAHAEDKAGFMLLQQFHQIRNTNMVSSFLQDAGNFQPFTIAGRSRMLSFLMVSSEADHRKILENLPKIPIEEQIRIFQSYGGLGKFLQSLTPQQKTIFTEVFPADGPTMRCSVRVLPDMLNFGEINDLLLAIRELPNNYRASFLDVISIDKLINFYQSAKKSRLQDFRDLQRLLILMGELDIPPAICHHVKRSLGFAACYFPPKGKPIDPNDPLSVVSSDLSRADVLNLAHCYRIQAAASFIRDANRSYETAIAMYKMLGAGNDPEIQSYIDYCLAHKSPSATPYVTPSTTPSP